MQELDQTKICAGWSKPDLLAIEDRECLVLDDPVVRGVITWKGIIKHVIGPLIASKYAVSAERDIAITLSSVNI